MKAKRRVSNVLGGSLCSLLMTAVCCCMCSYLSSVSALHGSSCANPHSCLVQPRQEGINDMIDRVRGSPNSPVTAPWLPACIPDIAPLWGEEVCISLGPCAPSRPCLWSPAASVLTLWLWCSPSSLIVPIDGADGLVRAAWRPLRVHWVHFWSLF